MNTINGIAPGTLPYIVERVGPVTGPKDVAAFELSVQALAFAEAEWNRHERQVAYNVWDSVRKQRIAAHYASDPRFHAPTTTLADLGDIDSHVGAGR